MPLSTRRRSSEVLEDDFEERSLAQTRVEPIDERSQPDLFVDISIWSAPQRCFATD